MPVIPEWQQQVGARGPLSPGPADTAPEAIGQVGVAIDQMHRQQEQREEEAGLVAANTELQSARAYWAEESEKRKNAAPADGAGFSAGVLKDFDQDAKSRLTKIKNERAREALRSQLESVRLGIQKDALDFEGGAQTRDKARKLEEGSNKAEIAAGFRPEDYNDILAEQLTAIAGSGLTDEQRVVAANEAAQRIAGSAVSGMIRKNPYTALAEINNEKSANEAINALAPEQRAAARSAAQSEINRRESEARAARAEAQDLLRGDISDAFTARAYGMPAKLPSRSQYVVAYGAEGADRYASDTKRWAIYDVVGEAAVQNPQEAQTTLEQLKPKTQEGATEAAANYEAAVKLYARQREILEANPVETLVRTDPAIREKGLAAAANPQLLPEYLDALVAKQKVLGVAEPKLLAEGQRAELAASLQWNPDAPRKRVETLNAIRNTYGSAFPAIMREVAPKLDGISRVLVNMAPTEAVRLDAAYAQKDTFKDTLPAGTSTAIKTALEQELAPFNATLHDNPDGPERAAEHAQAALIYAQMLTASGSSPEDAAKQAAGAVINSQFNYVDTLRIPSVYDSNQVVSALERTKAQLAKEGSFIVKPDGLSTQEEANADMRNLIDRQGYWITNETGTGAVLRIPHRSGQGEVYRADGSRVEVSFDELNEAMPAAGAWLELDMQRVDEGMR